MKKVLYIFFLFMFCIVTQAQTTITYQCILRSNAQKDTMCDGKVIPIFGITSTLGGAAKIPAKILYCNEGDSVILNTKSISQNEHHTIHLHGLDVDTRNDGDPSTSFWLTHQQDTTYSFRAKNAGTYLYHCHAADVIHVQMGMYGMIVVRAAGAAKTVWTGGPAYHKDYKWLTSEVDSVWHYHPPIHDTLMDTLHISKYVPNYFLINGKCGAEINADDSIQIKGAQGEKILMRMANIGYLANRIIFPSWLNAQILDSDGRPLPAAMVNDTCYMMPGERYSVLLQSGIQAIGTVTLDYIDMNTNGTTQTNLVNVNIAGVYSVKEIEKTKKELSVYPNPSNNQITISTDLTAPKTIEISNYLGQKVIEKEFVSTLDVSLLPDGLYIIKLKNNSGEFSTEKFIKR